MSQKKGPHSVLIIAEAGVNHNGSLRRALELVDAAAHAGADIVKFQTFQAVDLATAKAPKAAYQRTNTKATESQLSMLKKLELKPSDYKPILQACRKHKIEFLSTAFDNKSLEFLVNETKIRRIKIPSGELTNAPILLAAAHHRLPLLVSTGMATMKEIEAALGILAFGMLRSEEKPSSGSFGRAYRSPIGQRLLREKVTLLHCTTEYPAPFRNLHLNVLRTFQSLGFKTGYSDHSLGIEASVAAVALGATVIEKHLTIDKRLPGPDHLASLEPEEFKQLVNAIRNVEKALGGKKKQPSKAELGNKTVARKSIYAARNIKKGEILTPQNLTTKRPEKGISAINYFDLLGKRAARNVKRDEAL